jgi:integrase
MARTIRDAALESRAARGRLEARGKPYYRGLEPGLHLGYRKPLSGAGKWLARHYVGKQAYEVETLATADDFSDADGVVILSYRQAQEKARERMVARGHAAAGKIRPPTVADAMADYIEHLASRGQATRDTQWRADAHILSRLGNVEVAALTTDQLQRWLADLAKDGRRASRATANRILNVLKAALNRAWRVGKIPSNDAWRRVEPFENVGSARLRFLTVTEAQRLVNACDPDFKRLVRAALQTGCRYGELCRLEVADFDPDNGTLTIRQSKSGKSRHVVLTDEGAALFAQWTTGRAGHETMLLKATGEPWTKGAQTQLMRGACTYARITPPISFHSLRHTWASLSIMGGMPLPVVSANLGHADGRMVSKHYGHMARSYVADEIRRSAPRFGIEPTKVTPLHGKVRP